MPRPGPVIRESAVTADVALVAATETVIATVAGISTETPDERIDLHGFCQMTAAAAVTTTTLRIRRDSLTGALVGEANAVQTPASATSDVTLDVQDVPGAVAGQVYVLTAAVAGGNGTAAQQQVRAIQGVG